MIQDVYDNIGELLSSVLWEFYFIDDPPDFKYLVESITLPFIRFTSQTRSTGTKHIIGYEPETEFSIVFLNDKKLRAYKKMQEWQDSFYNKQKRVFISGGNFKRDAILSMQSFDKGVLVDIHVYRIRGIQLLGKESITFDYTNTEPSKFSCTFVADSIDEDKKTSQGYGGLLISNI